MKHGSSLPQAADNALHSSLSRLRERAGGEGRSHSFPRWGKVGMGAFAASCLGGVLGLRQEVGFRPDSRPHFFCVAKRNGGKKRRALQAACPAELPSLLRRSGQTGSRKSDFLCPSTPVLQLACGVAQALCLALPLLLAGEGAVQGKMNHCSRSESTIHSLQTV